MMPHELLNYTEDDMWADERDACRSPADVLVLVAALLVPWAAIGAALHFTGVL